MKRLLKLLAAAVSAVAAALLLKLAAEVLGSCSHKYIDVDAD